MAAIQPNMDFMVEESYPCMSHGCDKVFYVKADLNNMLKTIQKRCRRKIIVAVTAIKTFHVYKTSNFIKRRVKIMKIGWRIAGSTVLILMYSMVDLNSSCQHSKDVCYLPESATCQRSKT